MILLEIDPDGVVVIELECDAPGSVHVNGVAGWIETAQCMKIEARKIHVLGQRSYVQAVEPHQDAPVRLASIRADFPLSKSSSKPLLLKERIIEMNVSNMLTDVNDVHENRRG